MERPGEPALAHAELVGMYDAVYDGADRGIISALTYGQPDLTPAEAEEAMSHFLALHPRSGTEELSPDSLRTALVSGYNQLASLAPVRFDHYIGSLVRPLRGMLGPSPAQEAFYTQVVSDIYPATQTAMRHLFSAEIDALGRGEATRPLPFDAFVSGSAYQTYQHLYPSAAGEPSLAETFRKQYEAAYQLQLRQTGGPGGQFQRRLRGSVTESRLGIPEPEIQELQRLGHSEVAAYDILGVSPEAIAEAQDIQRLAHKGLLYADAMAPFAIRRLLTGYDIEKVVTEQEQYLFVQAATSLSSMYAGLSGLFPAQDLQVRRAWVNATTALERNARAFFGQNPPPALEALLAERSAVPDQPYSQSATLGASVPPEVAIVSSVTNYLYDRHVEGRVTYGLATYIEDTLARHADESPVDLERLAGILGVPLDDDTPDPYSVAERFADSEQWQAIAAHETAFLPFALLHNFRGEVDLEGLSEEQAASLNRPANLTSSEAEQLAIYTEQDKNTTYLLEHLAALRRNRP